MHSKIRVCVENAIRRAKTFGIMNYMYTGEQESLKYFMIRHSYKRYMAFKNL